MTLICVRVCRAEGSITHPSLMLLQEANTEQDEHQRTNEVQDKRDVDVERRSEILILSYRSCAVEDLHVTQDGTDFLGCEERGYYSTSIPVRPVLCNERAARNNHPSTTQADQYARPECEQLVCR